MVVFYDRNRMGRPIPNGLVLAFISAVICFGAVWVAINRVSRDAEAWSVRNSVKNSIILDKISEADSVKESVLE